MNNKYSQRRRSFAFKKQWIGRDASQKSLKRYCFEIWSNLVRERDRHICFMCGTEQKLTAHHLITKKWIPTSLQLICGITLCKDCHSVNVKCVHLSPWFLEEKLAQDRKEQYNWYILHRKNITNNPPIINYADELKRLLKEFEDMRPMEMLRGNYFKYTEAEEMEMISEYLNDKAGIGLLAKKWNCSKNTIKGILERHKIPKDTIRKTNKEARQKIFGHCVCSLDENNNIVSEYFSIYEAARCNGLSKNAIRNCIKGRTMTCDGKRWILKKDFELSQFNFREKKKLGPKDPSVLYKPITRIRQDGEKINYPSIKSVIKDGFNGSCLYNALKNGKAYKGYLWHYT